MILKELKIDTWIGDPTNCYVIFDEDSKEIMVIDPAGDVDKIEDLIKIVYKGNLKYINTLPRGPYCRCKRVKKTLWWQNINS